MNSYPFPNLTSNHRGFNNDSGLIYTRQNGMTQYEGKPIFGITQLPVPQYVNKANTEQAMENMNDGFKYEGGPLKNMKVVPPEKLAYGGSFGLQSLITTTENNYTKRREKNMI